MNLFSQPAEAEKSEAEKGAADLEAIMSGKGPMMDKEEMMEALMNQGGQSM